MRGNLSNKSTICNLYFLRTKRSKLMINFVVTKRQQNSSFIHLLKGSLQSVALKMWSIFVPFLSYLALSSSLEDKMYKMTRNMTLSSWTGFIQRTLTRETMIKCAGQCLYEKSICNAWHFNPETKTCQLGKVSRKGRS